MLPDYLVYKTCIHLYLKRIRTCYLQCRRIFIPNIVKCILTIKRSCRVQDSIQKYFNSIFNVSSLTRTLGACHTGCGWEAIWQIKLYDPLLLFNHRIQCLGEIYMYRANMNLSFSLLIEEKEVPMAYATFCY